MRVCQRVYHIITSETANDNSNNRIIKMKNSITNALRDNECFDVNGWAGNENTWFLSLGDIFFPIIGLHRFKRFFFFTKLNIVCKWITETEFILFLIFAMKKKPKKKEINEAKKKKFLFSFCEFTFFFVIFVFL